MAGRLDRVDTALSRLSRLRLPTPLDHMLRAQFATARNEPDQALAELALVPDVHFIAAQARLLAGQIELRPQTASVSPRASFKLRWRSIPRSCKLGASSSTSMACNFAVASRAPSSWHFRALSRFRPKMYSTGACCGTIDGNPVKRLPPSLDTSPLIRLTDGHASRWPKTSGEWASTTQPSRSLRASGSMIPPRLRFELGSPSIARIRIGPRNYSKGRA